MKPDIHGTRNVPGPRVNAVRLPVRSTRTEPLSKCPDRRDSGEHRNAASRTVKPT